MASQKRMVDLDELLAALKKSSEGHSGPFASTYTSEEIYDVAKMEALKIDSGYKNIVIPGIQDVNCAIDACIKVLKGDQA